MANEITAYNEDYFCTIAANDKRSKKIILNALNAATSLKDIDDAPFTITGIMTTPGKRPQTDTDCTNTYLILEDGSAYFSQSDGIAKSARWLHKIFTDEEIAEGIEVFIKPISLSGGRTLKTLQFVL